MTNDNCCNFKVLELNKIQIIITMFAEYKVTELFYMADDFYKFFDTILVKICSEDRKSTRLNSSHLA